MFYYVIKVLVSAIVIVIISEIAKRSTPFAALIAALPLTSLLAFIWLHIEGAASEHIAQLSMGIFWLVLPSLALFLALSILMRHGVAFWFSLAISIIITIVIYFSFFQLLRRLGVQL